MQLRTNRRRPGRYREDEVPELPPNPTAVEPTIPFDPELRPAAFPTLPLDRFPSEEPVATSPQPSARPALVFRDRRQIEPAPNMSAQFEERLEDPGEFKGPSPWSDDEEEPGPRAGLSAYDFTIEWSNFPEGVKLVIIRELLRDMPFHDVVSFLQLGDDEITEFINIVERELSNDVSEVERIERATERRVELIKNGYLAQANQEWEEFMDAEVSGKETQEPMIFTIRQDDMHQVRLFLRDFRYREEFPDYDPETTPQHILDDMDAIPTLATLQGVIGRLDSYEGTAVSVVSLDFDSGLLEMFYEASKYAKEYNNAVDAEETSENDPNEDLENIPNDDLENVPPEASKNTPKEAAKNTPEEALTNTLAEDLENTPQEAVENAPAKESQQPASLGNSQPRRDPPYGARNGFQGFGDVGEDEDPSYNPKPKRKDNRPRKRDMKASASAPKGSGIMNKQIDAVLNPPVTKRKPSSRNKSAVPPSRLREVTAVEDLTTPKISPTPKSPVTGPAKKTAYIPPLIKDAASSASSPGRSAGFKQNGKASSLPESSGGEKPATAYTSAATDNKPTGNMQRSERSTAAEAFFRTITKAAIAKKKLKNIAPSMSEASVGKSSKGIQAPTSFEEQVAIVTSASKKSTNDDVAQAEPSDKQKKTKSDIKHLNKGLDGTKKAEKMKAGTTTQSSPLKASKGDDDGKAFAQGDSAEAADDEEENVPKVKKGGRKNTRGSRGTPQKAIPQEHDGEDEAPGSPQSKRPRVELPSYVPGGTPPKKQRLRK